MVLNTYGREFRPPSPVGGLRLGLDIVRWMQSAGCSPLIRASAVLPYSVSEADGV